MKVHHVFQSPDRQPYRFTRKHPNETYAGFTGVFALSVEIDFAVQPLHFEAANDLECIDSENLLQHPYYDECAELGRVQVLVCVMPGSTAEKRENLARALNSGFASSGYSDEQAA